MHVAVVTNENPSGKCGFQDKALNVEMERVKSGRERERERGKERERGRAKSEEETEKQRRGSKRERYCSLVSGPLNKVIMASAGLNTVKWHNAMSGQHQKLLESTSLS